MEYNKNRFSPMRTMKKMAVCAVMALVCVGSSAQGKDFEKLEKIKGVEFLHIDKDMIKEAAENGKQLPFGNNQKFMIAKDDILRAVDDVAVYTCEEGKGIEKMKKSVHKVLKGDEWNTIFDISDKDRIIKILQSKRGEQVTSAIYMSEDSGARLVVINGSIGIAQLIKQIMGQKSE